MTLILGEAIELSIIFKACNYRLIIVLYIIYFTTKKSMELDKQKVKTIILCGGTGTRLREETEFKPKPMVEIGDKPILWHIMKIYNHYGFNDFVLALGYKSNYIKDYFLNQRHHTGDFSFNLAEGKVTNFFDKKEAQDNFNITFAETGLETPHGERVLKIKPHINEDIFMVTY